MPLFSLHVSAELEGVERIEPGDGFALRVVLECVSCRSPADKPSVFGFDDAVDVPNAANGAQASLVQRCKSCSAVGTVTLTTKADSAVLRAEGGAGGGGEGEGEGEGAGAGGPAAASAVLATADFRGWAPRAAVVASGWAVFAPSGAAWRDADLSAALGPHSEGWAEYDEAADAAVGVTNVVAEWRAAAADGKGKR